MQGNLTFSSFGLIWVAITLGSFGQIFLKKGLMGKELGGDSIFTTFLSILNAMTNPWVLTGLAIYVSSTFFWMLILSRVRLSVAYPLISMSYPVVVVLSAVILHERVDWLYAVGGLVFISAGVSLIGLGLGQGQGGKVEKAWKD